MFCIHSRPGWASCHLARRTRSESQNPSNLDSKKTRDYLKNIERFRSSIICNHFQSSSIIVYHLLSSSFIFYHLLLYLVLQSIHIPVTQSPSRDAPRHSHKRGHGHDLPPKSSRDRHPRRWKARSCRQRIRCWCQPWPTASTAIHTESTWMNHLETCRFLGCMTS